MKYSNNPAETFLQEAAELLEQVEGNALEIMPGMDCTESVNRLFRAFHTIKGSGSMFGFGEVAAFTHHIETALDYVRVGRMATSPELVALLLAARDHIAALLAASQTGKPADAEAGRLIIEELHALLPKEAEPEPEPAQSTTPPPPPASAEPATAAHRSTGFSSAPTSISSPPAPIPARCWTNCEGSANARSWATPPRSRR